MTFEYRDADGGHLSVTPLPGVPYVLVRTDPEGCAVPADLVPDAIAGIRDTARTASGQQPQCAPCGDTGACNGGPCAHPDAAPAVGQPAEAQAADEVCPPQVRWTVEHIHPRAGTVMFPGINDRDQVEERLKTARSRKPDSTHRLVRETTTWTVEDER